MKDELIHCYLPNTSIHLKQKRNMFRMNSDTVFLGEFMKIKEGSHVLDIGCNNGALLLYASMAHPSLLVGVDVFEEAISLCKQNLEENHIENYELHVAKIQEFQHAPFDAIVCNPPYFKNSGIMVNENEYMRVARHETYLNLEEVFSCSARLLKEQGVLFLVHRSTRLADIITYANTYHFGITNIQFVYDENNEEAVQILVEARKNLCHNISILRPKYSKR